MKLSMSMSVVVLALASIAGCVQRSIVGPSDVDRPITPVPTTTSVLVRVLDYIDRRTPIDATIIATVPPPDLGTIESTNDQGEAIVVVPRGVEITINVEARGYLGFGVSAIPTAAEIWTFYLEKQ